MKRILSIVLALGAAFAASADETTITASANVPETLTAEGVTWGESAIAAGENTLEAPEYAYLKTFSGIRYSCCGYAVSNVVGEVTSGDGRTATFTVDAAKGPYTILWKWNARTVLADKTFYANAATGDDGNTGEDAAHAFRTVKAAHVATTNYLAQNSGKTALISLAEGAYLLTNRITFVKGERMVGAGRDKTGISLRNAAYGTGSGDCALKLVSADNLLSSLCVTGRPSAGCSRAIVMSAGRIEYVRSAYHYSSNNDCYGIALYVTGGEAQFCLLDKNVVDAMYARGVGAWVGGSGVLQDSEITDNQDSASRSGRGQGLYVESSGVVRRCRIHHQNTQKYQWLSGSIGGGVYLVGGVLENSLVYNNWCKGAEAGGGIYNDGGTVRYCTIYGNTCNGDTTGASGLYQNKGTSINNIIFGNYKAGAIVKSGTCVTNLVGTAIAGRAANFVTEDPLFTDAANFDFTIAKRSSLAVGNAQPLAAVTTDFVGLKREDAPTIGAYEYDSSKETFEVALQIPKVTNLYGTKVAANAVVSGKGGATIAIDWYVDGVKTPALANLESVEIENLDYGWHSLRVEATKGTDVKFDEVAKAVTIVSDRVYVNMTGNGTYPYASAATGTNDLTVALNALWQADGHVSTVDVDEGTYQVTAQVLLMYPIVLAGHGADKTVLRPKSALGMRGFLLQNSKSVVSDVTISNYTGFGAAQIEAGLMTRCHFIACTDSEYCGLGGAVLMKNGSLRDSTIEKCHISGLNVRGGGIHIANGLVSNCTIRACTCHCGTRSPENQHGGGLSALGGTVWNTRILDCADVAGNYSRGVGLCVDRDANYLNAVFRNCLVANCSSVYWSPVELRYGIFHNCTFTANRASGSVSGVEIRSVEGASSSVPTLVNSVIWGNGSDPSIVTNAPLTHCCYPQGTNGTNTARNPKLRARHDYEISPFGSCYRAGKVQSWMAGAADLNGRPRTTDSKVDIGCHQVPPPKGAAFGLR